jgi:aspartate carbamoyltransferase regulatory subunit
MLNISGIQDGYVIDHIRAGKSMDIYKYLRLDKLDCQVAIIKNATSNKMGKKDIIKVHHGKSCKMIFMNMDLEMVIY